MLPKVTLHCRNSLPSTVNTNRYKDRVIIELVVCKTFDKKYHAHGKVGLIYNKITSKSISSPPRFLVLFLLKPKNYGIKNIDQ